MQRVPYPLVCLAVIVLSAAAVWWLLLPSEPQLAFAESAFAGMTATAVSLVIGWAGI